MSILVLGSAAAEMGVSQLLCLEQSEAGKRGGREVLQGWW